MRAPRTIDDLPLRVLSCGTQATSSAYISFYDLPEFSGYQGHELDHVRTRNSRTPRPILRRMSVRRVTPLA